MKPLYVILLLVFLAGLSSTVLCGQDEPWLRERIQEVRKLTDYANWPRPQEGLLAGPTLLPPTLEMIMPLPRVWERDTCFIETVGKDVFVRLVRYWRKEDQILTLTTVVGPSADAVRWYLLNAYALTQAPPAALPRPVSDLGPEIGEVRLALRQPDGKSFVRIDLLRANVLLMMHAEGMVAGRLPSLAKRLDEELRIQAAARNWNELPRRPKIAVLEPEKRIVSLGDDPIPIFVEVSDPGKRELHWFWTMDAGGVEKNLLDDYVYTPSEPGRHRVTLTVVNDIGLYDTASFEIEVSGK